MRQQVYPNPKGTNLAHRFRNDHPKAKLVNPQRGGQPADSRAHN
jgi:hypothetical protein